VSAPEDVDQSAISSEVPREFREHVGSAVTARPTLRNVISGLRLLTFRKVDASAFVPSARQVLFFTLIAVLIWIAYDRLGAGDKVFFDPYALAQLGWLILVTLALFVIFTPTSQGLAVLGRESIAAASMLPILLVLALLVGYFARESSGGRWLGPLVAIVAVVYLFRAKHNAGRESAISAFVGSVAIVLITAWTYNETVAEPLQFWYSSTDVDEAPLDWGGAEEQIYRQPELLDRALAGLETQNPDRADVYFVGFAGYGAQDVFLKEANFARDSLAQHYDLRKHSLILANSPVPAHDALLASTTALRRSLGGVALKMDVANDVLMLYITSHGSEDGSVAVSESGMPFNDLYAEDLRSALQASGIQWRVIIVSACYSGTFISPLKDDRTAIFTASRADRTSFGCSDERDLTYFGEALFRDALPASGSLLDAFTQAQRIIAKREQEEGLDPSQPQLYIGERMRAKLRELGFVAKR
jgi:hypothetical protein